LPFLKEHNPVGDFLVVTVNRMSDFPDSPSVPVTRAAKIDIAISGGVVRPFVSFAAAAVFALGVAGPIAAQAQTTTSNKSRLEIQISGPRLIRRDFPIKMMVTFTNQSEMPLALRFPFFFIDSTRLDWVVTDGAGHQLPPPPPIPIEGVCPVTGPVVDWSITVLDPGETMDYEFAGDPSDSVVFKGKGFYRVSLHYVLTPTDYAAVGPYRPASERPGKYTP
jgi:hypothetical protein